MDPAAGGITQTSPETATHPGKWTQQQATELKQVQKLILGRHT